MAAEQTGSREMKNKQKNNKTARQRRGRKAAKDEKVEEQLMNLDKYAGRRMRRAPGGSSPADVDVRR